MATTYKIRFKKAAQVERAHADRAKGGYWIQPIEVGTEMTVNEASFRFWDRKGVVDLVGKIDEPGVVNPFMAAQTFAPIDPFALLGAEQPKALPSRADIAGAAERARKAVAESDRTAMHAALTELASDGVAEALPDISLDSHTVIEAAIDDLNAGRQVDARELSDALDEVTKLAK